LRKSKNKLRGKVPFSKTHNTLLGGRLREPIRGLLLRFDLDPQVTERDFGQPIGAVGFMSLPA